MIAALFVVRVRVVIDFLIRNEKYQARELFVMVFPLLEGEGSDSPLEGPEEGVENLGQVAQKMLPGVVFPLVWVVFEEVCPFVSHAC